jgi:hypothetical protein
MSEDRRLRCAHCGELLGVYEPIVVRDGRGSRETSIAAEPGLQASPADVYHARCLPSGGV